jgi:hypothetical protein
MVRLVLISATLFVGIAALTEGGASDRAIERHRRRRRRSIARSPSQTATIRL